MIIGLTDPASIRVRVPNLGKLRKGGEKTASGFGPDLDHFRFTSKNPAVETAFNTAFPTPPSSLYVYLPYDTLEQCFPCYCEVWSASGLEHRCDGHTANIWRDGDKMRTGSKPCPGGHKDGNPRSDAVGRLEVVIPQLLEAGFVGTVTMETHADGHDIPFIAGVLADVEAKRGKLTGVMFRLYRSKESITVPGWGDRKGQRTRTEKWLVRIEPAAEWVRHQIALARADALALPAGDVVDAETGEIVTLTPALPAAPSPLAIAAPTPAPAVMAAQGGSAKPSPAVAAIREALTSAPAKPLTNSQKVAAQAAAPQAGDVPQKYKDRWSQLVGWANQLGVPYTGIKPAATANDYVDAGVALKRDLLTKAKGMLPAQFNWPENDDTIEAAIANIGVAATTEAPAPAQAA